MSRAQQAIGPASIWIVSPWFDLALIANLGWLLLLLPGVFASDGVSHVEFWQVYYLTTPHRWITLLLVASDPDRRAGRTWPFVAIAIIAFAVVFGVHQWTGAFTCLALADYIWNAWHFGAQHGGVFRMYARKAGDDWPKLETWGMRTLVVYVALRLASWTTGWTEDSPAAVQMLQVTDLLILILPASLVLHELMHWSSRHVAKLTYLLSVSLLYAGLLWALNIGNKPMILMLTAGSAVFHAVEYLAIVTHYAMRRRQQGSAGLFQAMALRWGGMLAMFMLVWGTWGFVMESGGQSLATLWVGMNLWAAALHYAYDGMIWKLRNTNTAKVLDVAGTSAAKPTSSRSAGTPTLVGAAE
jgi:hypothetical protein